MPGPKLVLMGFEKQLFIGAAGSSAASEVLDVVNLKVSIAHQYGKTGARSDTGGGASPIETSRVVSRKVSVTFNTLNVPANTNLVTIKAAASAGTPIAIKVVDVASGAVEVDGDLTVRRGHEIAHEVSNHLKSSALSVQDVTVHVEPALAARAQAHAGTETVEPGRLPS